MKNIFRLSAAILPLFLIYSCKKDNHSIPSLTTTTISNITYTTATSGGIVSNEGGATVVSRGVCWNTSANPTTTNSITIDNAGLGAFVSNITNLSPNTLYHVRAYAISSFGTGYGDEVTFTTSSVALPGLTTTAVTDLTQTTAVSGGNITADNGGSITARGVCWAAAPNPTIADNKTSDGVGMGTFVSSLSGLTPETIYYLRAYATNSAGTSYGNELSFTTLVATVTDIDQHVYNMLTIGTQVWMAQNLKTTKYRNGDLIGTTTPATLDYSSENTPKYQWAYNGDEANVAAYGRLYTWDAITDSRGVCPTGWHIPSDAEWTTMTTFLGGENVAGGKLKETATTHWITPNTAATNESGFTALPGGLHGVNGAFIEIGTSSCWWSATESDPLNAWFRLLNYAVAYVTRDNTFGKRVGLSVRCIKN